MSLFGCFFVGQSYPILNEHFSQVDSTHWVRTCCLPLLPNSTEHLTASGTLVLVLVSQHIKLRYNKCNWHACRAADSVSVY
jgi:hypothetical protein